MKHAIIAIVVLLAGAAAFGQSLEVHGIYPGMSVEAMREVASLHGWVVRGGDDAVDGIEFGDGTLMHMTVADRKVAQFYVLFFWTEYDRQLKHAISKWGPAQRGNARMMNGYGATYPYRYAHWKNKTATAYLAERSEGDVEYGVLMLTSRTLRQPPSPQW